MSDRLPPGTFNWLMRMWAMDAHIRQFGTVTTPDYRLVSGIGAHEPRLTLKIPITAAWVHRLDTRDLIANERLTPNGVTTLRQSARHWREACRLRAGLREADGTARYGKTYGVALKRAMATSVQFGHVEDPALIAFLADVVTQGCERLLRMASAYERDLLREEP